MKIIVEIQPDGDNCGKCPHRTLHDYYAIHGCGIFKGSKGEGFDSGKRAVQCVAAEKELLSMRNCENCKHEGDVFVCDKYQYGKHRKECREKNLAGWEPKE